MQNLIWPDNQVPTRWASDWAKTGRYLTKKRTLPQPAPAELIPTSLPILDTPGEPANLNFVTPWYLPCYNVHSAKNDYDKKHFDG